MLGPLVDASVTSLDALTRDSCRLVAVKTYAPTPSASLTCRVCSQQPGRQLHALVSWLTAVDAVTVCVQVCFAMFMPNLLRNFLYVRHNSGCWWLDLILRFVASELHCCTNFSRKFFWSSEW